MRKITNEAVHAFNNNKSYKNKNTEIRVDSVGVEYLLHDNLIAHKYIGGNVAVSLAGWNTKVTRERLNGIPGVSISTHKGQAYLNGNPIDDNKFYTI